MQADRTSVVVAQTDDIHSGKLAGLLTVIAELLAEEMLTEIQDQKEGQDERSPEGSRVSH